MASELNTYDVVVNGFSTRMRLTAKDAEQYGENATLVSEGAESTAPQDVEAKARDAGNVSNKARRAERKPSRTGE